MSAIHNINGTTTTEAFTASHAGHDVVTTRTIAACRTCGTYQPLRPVADYSVDRIEGAREALGRCSLHPAYAVDYCPVCGTATTIGGKA